MMIDQKPPLAPLVTRRKLVTPTTGIDREELRDALLFVVELAGGAAVAVGTAAAAYWTFRKAKCEACAASWELAAKAAETEEEEEEDA